MNKYKPQHFFFRRADAVSPRCSTTKPRTTNAVAPACAFCTSAGEALPESVGNSWKSRFGVDILDGVGSTELLHIFLSNAPGDIKYGSSGRPVPGYRVRLVNEAGSDVADGEVGELLVDCAPRPGKATTGNQRSKSRQTFEGHWDPHRRQVHSRRRWPLLQPSAARSDDMFKVSGIWVSPFEVESALITHPAVAGGRPVVPESRSGRIAEAQGVRGAASGRGHRRPS